MKIILHCMHSNCFAFNIFLLTLFFCTNNFFHSYSYKLFYILSYKLLGIEKLSLSESQYSNEVNGACNETNELLPNLKHVNQKKQKKHLGQQKK